MAGELITEDFQYEFNGLLIGSGTTVDVVEATGLDDLPDVASADFARDAAHGSDAGTDLARDRVVTIAGEIFEATEADMAAALSSFRDAFTITSSVAELAWQHPGEDPRVIFARCRRRSIPTNLARSLGAPVWTVQLVATDPLIYSATESEASTSRTVPGTGFLVPFTAPFTLGAATAGTVRLTNAGSVAAPWTARLEGPLTDPVLTNLSTGDRLSFTANGGLTLAAGEYVDLASDGRSVLLAGTADRRLTLSLDSRWWSLPPGDTDIELAADAGTGTLAVTHRSAWI